MKCYKRTTMQYKSLKEVNQSLVESFAHASWKRKHFNWDLGDNHTFSRHMWNGTENRSVS